MNWHGELWYTVNISKSSHKSYPNSPILHVLSHSNTESHGWMDGGQGGWRLGTLRHPTLDLPNLLAHLKQPTAQLCFWLLLALILATSTEFVVLCIRQSGVDFESCPICYSIMTLWHFMTFYDCDLDWLLYDCVLWVVLLPQWRDPCPNHDINVHCKPSVAAALLVRPNPSKTLNHQILKKYQHLDILAFIAFNMF